MSSHLPVPPEPQHSKGPRSNDPSTADPPSPTAPMDRVSVTAFVFSLVGASLVAIPLGNA
jgi:hypothetical protein